MTLSLRHLLLPLPLLAGCVAAPLDASGQRCTAASDCPAGMVCETPSQGGEGACRSSAAEGEAPAPTAPASGNTTTPTSPAPSPTTTPGPTPTSPTPTPTPSAPAEETVSFSQQVQPVLQAYCVSCHGSSGNLSLSATKAYAQLMLPADCNGSLMRVVPFQPQQSLLWMTVADDPHSCVGQMPRREALKVLSEPDFLLIERWIAQGAQNN